MINIHLSQCGNQCDKYVYASTIPSRTNLTHLPCGSEQKYLIVVCHSNTIRCEIYDHHFGCRIFHRLWAPLSTHTHTYKEEKNLIYIGIQSVGCYITHTHTHIRRCRRNWSIASRRKRPYCIGAITQIVSFDRLSVCVCIVCLMRLRLFSTFFSHFSPVVFVCGWCPGLVSKSVGLISEYEKVLAIKITVTFIANKNG